MCDRSAAFGVDYVTTSCTWPSGLIELRRVLKPTGSIYLHCDDTAAGYLRVLCDAVFGPRRFGAEIVWQRQTSHNSVTRGYGRNTDRILWYRNGSTWTWNPVYHERSAAALAEYQRRL